MLDIFWIRWSSSVFPLLSVIGPSFFIHSTLGLLHSNISIWTCSFIRFIFTLWDGNKRNWIFQTDHQWHGRTCGISTLFSSIWFILLGLLAVAWRSRLQIQCTRRSKRWMGCHAIFLVLSISFATSVSNKSGLHTFCFSRKRSKKFKYGKKNFTASCGIYFALFIQWSQRTQDGFIKFSDFFSNFFPEKLILRRKSVSYDS